MSPIRIRKRYHQIFRKTVCFGTLLKLGFPQKSPDRGAARIQAGGAPGVSIIFLLAFEWNRKSLKLLEVRPNSPPLRETKGARMGHTAGKKNVSEGGIKSYLMKWFYRDAPAVARRS